MKTRKIIITCIFLTLIAVTAIGTVVSAIDSYQFDMDPANGVDIMEGMAAAMLMVLGGFVVFYEFDLFYTVYYFLVKPKTVAQSVLNIVSNVCLLLQFFSPHIARALLISEEINVAIALFFAYLILRCVCSRVSAISSKRIEKHGKQ